MPDGIAGDQADDDGHCGRDINFSLRGLNGQKRKYQKFCIIAYIDHGKSTLADRLIEMTGTVSERDMAEQSFWIRWI